MMDKVLCLVQTYEDIGEVDEDIDLEPIVPKSYKIREVVTPLIDHLHNDIENGQKEPHYHIDTRYMTGDTGVVRVYPHELKSNEKLEFRLLERKNIQYEHITPVSLIKNSKLKHNCIHKGKCPHRGFDLSKVEPHWDNWLSMNVIECPLHGLKFNKYSKKIVNLY